MKEEKIKLIKHNWKRVFKATWLLVLLSSQSIWLAVQLFTKALESEDPREYLLLDLLAACLLCGDVLIAFAIAKVYSPYSETYEIRAKMVKHG